MRLANNVHGGQTLRNDLRAKQIGDGNYVDIPETKKGGCQFAHGHEM